jgi:arylsulfatase A-like enzyme
MLSRRELLAGSTLLPARLFGANPRKPNIVLILADDLGYAGLSVQESKDVPTPNIDSIAANGVRFTDGYVTCPVCAPTRAGLLTGRYQQRFGFETNPGPEAYADEKFGLPRDQDTLADRLKPLGYATGMFGKWHLGYKPELTPPRRGFDEFFGFLSGANNYIPAAGRQRNPILRGMDVVQEKEYFTDALAREAVAFIEKRRADPFFLYLPFNAVHAPLEAVPKYLDRFTAIKDEKRRTYAAMTAAMDDAVGRVLDTLRRLNLEEDTLVFFLSDNGGPTPQTTSSNAPLRGYKGQVLEGGIRVPFLMQWKGRVPAGRVYRNPVMSLDIHPTALAAAGATIRPEWSLDGVSLLPYLTGNNPGKPHETLYWRFHQQHAIRQGDWKLVTASGSPRPQLFNLAQDIGESKDLAAAMPAKVKELEAAWQAWNAQLQDPKWMRQDGRTEGNQPGRGVEQRFRQLDRNSDGKLTKDEFPGAAFQRMDANGDGQLTLEEARAFSVNQMRRRDRK